MPLDNEQYEAGLGSLASCATILKKRTQAQPPSSGRCVKPSRPCSATITSRATFKKGGRIVLAMPYIPTDKNRPPV